MQNRPLILLVGACIVTTSLAVVFATLWLAARARPAPVPSQGPPAVAVAQELAVRPGIKGPFAEIPENSIPGRYKWIENGQPLGVVLLHPDHSLTNVRGEKKSGYRWILQPEGLLLVYLSTYDSFSHVLAPGIYEGQREDKSVRIEKESSDPVMER